MNRDIQSSLLLFILVLILILLVFAIEFANFNENNMKNNDSLIPLPNPVLQGEVSLEQAISERRSIRSYEDYPLALKEVSRVLWAAQGITEPELDFRAAPSAGALYPLSVYVVIEEVEGINQGIYRYAVKEHKLKMVSEKSVRDEVYKSALMQSAIREAPFIIIIAADYDIIRRRYGERAERYVHMEAGHAGQNIYLQATALGLGTVAIGAFEDERIKEVIGLKEEDPLYIFPIGKK